MYRIGRKRVSLCRQELLPYIRCKSNNKSEDAVRSRELCRIFEERPDRNRTDDEMMSGNIGQALLLSLMAGCATGIGSAIAFFAKKTNAKFLSFSLGLSAGVMIYISFMELLFSSRQQLEVITESTTRGSLITALAFFGGIFIAGLIDKFIPDTENPHELHSVEEIGGVPNPEHTHRLRRMGIVTALAIAVHNFPEGIATFISALDSAKVGIAVAAAVAVHNIPEGIAVSVPIYFSTGSRKKAFWYSFASGLAEPVGAVFAYLLLMPFLTPVLMECTFAVVAGIMVYISLDELLPAAHQYGHSHLAIYGLVAGMAVMALSLILLG